MRVENSGVQAGLGYKLHYFKRGGGNHFHTMIELLMINGDYAGWALLEHHIVTD